MYHNSRTYVHQQTAINRGPETLSSEGVIHGQRWHVLTVRIPPLRVETIGKPWENMGKPYENHRQI